MPAEENKALTHRLYEELNSGNLAVLDELLAPDYVVHDLDRPSFLGNRQTHKDFTAWFQATFSGQRRVEEMRVEEDKVVVHHTFYGTPKSEWQGIPAGQEVKFPVIQTYRIADGKIVEEWHQDHK